MGLLVKAQNYGECPVDQIEVDTGKYLHKKVKNTMKRQRKYIMIQRVVDKKESPEEIFNRAMKGAVSYALGNGLTRADVMKKTRNFCGSEFVRVTEDQDSDDEGSRNDSSEESGEEDGVSDDERGQDTPSPKKTATHSNANTAGKTPEGDKSTAPISTTTSEDARRNAKRGEIDVEDGLSDGKYQQDTPSQKRIDKE